jgi:hypothetical protein
MKVQDQALVDKNSKWKEWWQTIQEITKEQIQDNLELIRVDEEAYLNELVAYKLKFQGYKYVWLITKLIEEPIKVLQKKIPRQPIPTGVSSQDEPIAMTTKIPTHMKGGTKAITTSYILSLLPTKLVEAHFVAVSAEVADLQIPLSPKLVPLGIPHIGVGAEVTMIDTTLHASKVFRTPGVVLKNTLVIEKLKPKPNTLVEPTDV